MKKLIIIISILILCTIYLYNENNKLEINNYNIINHNIPSDFNNYKIIQISDFHNTKSKALTTTIIKEIEKQKPNIIVLTGDLIDANKTNIDITINFIKEINNIAPIYFITGNHEASINNYSYLQDKLEENKVVILDNKLQILEKNGTEINLIGINDPAMQHNPYETNEDIITSEINSIDFNRNNYTILLSHRPELFKNYVNNNIDLVLTGHAHGGQIRLPFIGGLIAPNQGLLPKYTNGIKEKNNTTMVISRGIGNSILPFRINNKPELLIITLKNN